MPKTDSETAETKIEQPKMVGWYDPKLLARSGVEVAVSTVFGRHSDHRLVEALSSGKKKLYDYTSNEMKVVRESDEDSNALPHGPDRSSICIDYVGDVGDGWNSTYAVAYYIAEAHYLADEDRRKFRYRDKTGNEIPITPPKGDILIFGGDEVYPTASREAYEQRLIAPYEAALRCTDSPHPHVFAVPGNHDWYDSLVAFTRLFTSRRWFAGWKTHQNRSYFALKLPHGWWLLGTDVQLGSDIDKPQVEYFEWVADQMEEETRRTGMEARIILCHAEPHWINAQLYNDLDSAYDESNLEFLENKLGKKVAVFIAGDLHHYRRHEALDGSSQKITAGGGGAFLHPTHTGRRGVRLDYLEKRRAKEAIKCPSQEPKPPPDDRIFKKKASYPSEKESSRQCWRNLLFPYNEGNASRRFGILPAILYLLITLSVLTNPEQWKNKYDLSIITATALYSVISSPFTLLWVLVIVLGFLLFTDTHSTLYRVLMGGFHGVVHVLAAFGVAMLSIYLIRNSALNSWVVGPLEWGGYHFKLDFRILSASLLVLVGGFLVGPFILGLYLLVSMNFFGRHSNEAFSSIAVQDWKHFLKLHIDEHGVLTIYPIGIKRVPRKWKKKPKDGTGPELVPDIEADPKATAPELIEPPIRLERTASTVTGVIATDSESYPERRAL